MIYVIGMGTEGKGSLSGRALRLIERAGLVAGGARHLAAFAGVSAKKIPVKGGLDALTRAVRAHVKGGSEKDAVVIATGDPLLFGIGDYIIKTFGKRRVCVIPNVSTVQEAFARIKESANGVKVLSAHGRGGSVDALADEISACNKAAVFTDAVTTPAKIARALVRRGQADYTAYVCESLGAKDEKVAAVGLAALGRRKRFAPLNVLVLIRKGGGAAVRAARSAPGIPDAAFARSKGLITKEEIRVVSLAKLRLHAGSVVWDIGAGSGSVAVEAALLCTEGAVYAVEKDPARVRHIEGNMRRFHADNIRVICGKAPGCLKKEALPAPDAVFVGGGGADIVEILDFALKKIKKNGRIVVNAVTIETASRAFEFFKKSGMENEMLMINVSRARGLAGHGGLNLLSANNPVFVIAGTCQ